MFTIKNQLWSLEFMGGDQNAINILTIYYYFYLIQNKNKILFIKSIIITKKLYYKNSLGWHISHTILSILI